ncbi:hypothetical protein [Sulfurimonas sp.]
MRIVIIVILMDLFIFTISSIFADNERQILKSKKQTQYHVDRFGYYWQVE